MPKWRRNIAVTNIVGLEAAGGARFIAPDATRAR
jgi:hypothetical protein